MCIAGTEGVQCERDVDECASCPCQNGATCVQPRLNMFACQCTPGFTGVQCELPILPPPVDPCSSQPCKNNAQCVLVDYAGTALPQFPQFQCICPAGFTGVFCDISVDSCVTPGSCIRNFNNLNFNLYGLPYNFNFISYQDCILKTWAILNPSS